MAKKTYPCDYSDHCPYDAQYSQDCYNLCGLGADEDEEEKEQIYLTDITGTIGEWLDAGFDSDVPAAVVKVLQLAYELATKEL